MARIRLERGPVVCERGELATSLWKRTKGLLGRSGLADENELASPYTPEVMMLSARLRAAVQASMFPLT